MVDLTQIPEIEELLIEIQKTQGTWDGKCNETNCYWNMWHPKWAHGRLDNEESKICVSESLTDTKMEPNSKKCPGYYDYHEACGCKKGE